MKFAKKIFCKKKNKKKQQREECWYNNSNEIRDNWGSKKYPDDIDANYTVNTMYIAASHQLDH